VHVAETRERARADLRFGLAGWLHYFQKVVALPGVPETGDPDYCLDAMVDAGFVICGEPDDLSKQIARLEDVSDDLKLALALKALNSTLPLTARGEIMTPGWLLDHPEAGYALISGPVPDRLARKDSELWLSRLKTRASQVRERAKQLDIGLNEDEMRVHLLSTSRTRLAAVWADRRRLKQVFALANRQRLTTADPGKLDPATYGKNGHQVEHATPDRHRPDEPADDLVVHGKTLAGDMETRVAQGLGVGVWRRRHRPFTQSHKLE
jgi:hypothetical protein